MAFFDHLSTTISEKSRDVAKKAKDFAETTKLGSMISTEEDAIARTYGEIGKSYFEQHKDSAEDPFRDKIEEILSAQERIAQLKVQIQQIQGTKVCPKCGAEISDSAAFCPACGTKIPESAPAPASAEGAEATAETAGEAESTQQPPAVCPNCGEVREPGARFCRKCGIRFPDDL